MPPISQTERSAPTRDRYRRTKQILGLGVGGLDVALRWGKLGADGLPVARAETCGRCRFPDLQPCSGARKGCQGQAQHNQQPSRRPARPTAKSGENHDNYPFLASDAYPPLTARKHVDRLTMPPEASTPRLAHSLCADQR